MIPEKIISASDLMPRLPEVLDDIHGNGAVYIVHSHERDTDLVPAGLINDAGEMSFVLGSPDVCGGVSGVVDPEYGWPQFIDVRDVNTLSDVMPGYRLHPFLTRGSRCLAVSVMINEYKVIRERMSAKPQGHDDPLP